MSYFLLPFHLAQGIGVLGFFIYVTTYSLLTLRVLTPASVWYFMLNLTASTCVLIGLTVSFNLAAALIQTFWVCMSLVGITLHIVKPCKRNF